MSHPGQYADVNGIKLYHESHGQGEPLLLLHGGSATIESFYQQLPEFAAKYRVIAADSRGHGRTADTDAPLSYELMANDFAALIRSLNVGPVSIVGWSDGGIIGLHLAMYFPDLVKKLVVIGSGFHVDGMAKEYLEGVRQSKAEEHHPILLELYRQLSPNGPAYWPVFYEKLRQLWLTSPNYTREQIAKITQPTLVMVGDRDIVTPEHSLHLFQTLPNAQLCIIPGASHFVPVEKPALVNQVILSFLESSG